MPSVYVGLLHCQIWGIIYRQLSDHFCYSFKMKVEWAVLLCVEVNLFCRRTLQNRLVWNVWEGKWDAINTGQFSVRVVIAVYLLIAHSPCLWQRLGCNQLTGWVVRGVTCLNNLAPVWAEVSWANSQRAKLAGFWTAPLSQVCCPLRKKTRIFCGVLLKPGLPILLCKATEERKVLQVRNAQIIGWKTVNRIPRSLHCYIWQGEILTEELLLYQKRTAELGFRLDCSRNNSSFFF